MFLTIKIKDHKLLTAHVSRVMDNKLEGIFRIDFIGDNAKDTFLEYIGFSNPDLRIDLEKHQNNKLFPNSLFFSNKMVTLFEVTN